MKPVNVPTELINHLCRTSVLSASQAEHLVTEVLNYYAENSQDFMVRRHAELQSLGFNNKHIFDVIQQELTERRFSGPHLSQRQIRRAIYG